MPPSELSCVCPNCGTRLWAIRRGEWTLQNRILKLGPTGFLAKCPDCSTDVPVPWLTLSDAEDEVAPPAPSVPGAGTRMVVRTSA